jgi:hypothetical protein
MLKEYDKNPPTAVTKVSIILNLTLGNSGNKAFSEFDIKYSRKDLKIHEMLNEKNQGKQHSNCEGEGGVDM